MTKRALVKASHRFAQNRMAGESVPGKTYEQQKIIVSEAIEAVLDQFCPRDFLPDTPEVVLYPGLTNDTQPFSVLDEIVGHAGCGVDRLFITQDLVEAVESCFGAYFDVVEQYDDGYEFDRGEEGLKAATRLVAAAWLFDSLDPRIVHDDMHDNPIYKASLQAGILDRGEGSVEDSLDVARFRIMGAIARNGFKDDEKYATFQITYRAMFEAQLDAAAGNGTAEDPLFGMRFALAHACSDRSATEMLERMHNVNQVIERYI